MSSRYKDDDGIDAPFNKAWDAAIREDKIREEAKRLLRANGTKCKHCRRDFMPLTDAQRVDYHAALWAVLHGDIQYHAYDPTQPPVNPERTAAFAIGAASVYADWLMAADQGLCRSCTDQIEGPAT